MADWIQTSYYYSSLSFLFFLFIQWNIYTVLYLLFICDQKYAVNRNTLWLSIGQESLLLPVLLNMVCCYSRAIVTIVMGWGVCSWPWQWCALGKADCVLFVTTNWSVSGKNTSGWKLSCFLQGRCYTYLLWCTGWLELLIN